MIKIGIDPDSDSHGIAVYTDGVLTELKSLKLFELRDYLEGLSVDSIAIEDVMLNQFIYARNTHANKTVQSKIAMFVGRCQQSYVELTRMLDYYDYKYKAIPPSKSNWAKDKALFERVTGWEGRSNEDTRSAAYFGQFA